MPTNIVDLQSILVFYDPSGSRDTHRTKRIDGISKIKVLGSFSNQVQVVDLVILIALM